MKAVKHIQRAARRTITLMAVPDLHGEIKSVHLSLLSIYILATIAFLTTITLGWAFLDYQGVRSQLSMEMNRLEGKEAEVQELLEKTEVQRMELQTLAELTEELRHRMEQLERVGEEVNRLQSEVNQSNAGPVLPVQIASLVPVGGGDYQELQTETLIRLLHEELADIRESLPQRSNELEVVRDELQAEKHRQDHTPSIWPVVGRVTSSYGNRIHPVTRVRTHHDGIDIAAAEGTPIRATAAGVVEFAGNRGGYGITVIIDHGYGLKTLYAHNSRLNVQRGDRVTRGQIISFAGSTGVSTGPHLHYEVLRNGKPVNPTTYLP